MEEIKNDKKIMCDIIRVPRRKRKVSFEERVWKTQVKTQRFGRFFLRKKIAFAAGFLLMAMIANLGGYAFSEEVLASNAAEKEKAVKEKIAAMPHIEIAQEKIFQQERKDFQINEDPIFKIKSDAVASQKEQSQVLLESSQKGKLKEPAVPGALPSFEGMLNQTLPSARDALKDITAPVLQNGEGNSGQTETESNSGQSSQNEKETPVSSAKMQAGSKIVRSFFQKIFGVFSASAQEIPSVVATVLDGNGQNTDIAALVKESADSAAEIRIAKPERSFKPGKYQLKVEMLSADGTRVLTSTQDFTWGILAINTNKSIYSPGETTKLAIGVLDESGNMVCDAKLKLEITDTQGNAKTLSTEDEEIKVNTEVCSSHELTLTPDYEAQYKTGEWGKYEMILTAETANETHTIKDSFEVSNLIPFDVERATATRINPKNVYPVTFEIAASEDFSGEIQERMPVSFEVSKGDEKNYVSFGEEKTKDKEKILTWNVKLEKGEKISLGYQFDAPDESPQFYLLGPLRFVEKDKAVFEEARQWQIASDAPPPYKMTTGRYVGNGNYKSVSGLGFRPEAVIVKGVTAGAGALLKTTDMIDNTTTYLGPATADNTAGLITLDEDGFTVTGTNANAANTSFTWAAFAGSNCSTAGQFCVGRYVGSGANKAITTGFQPNLAIVSRTTAVAASWRTTNMSNSYGQYFAANAQDSAGALFTTMDATGFTVGASINSVSAGIYYFLAFKNTANSVSTGNYQGNGTSLSITDVGFAPDFVFVKNAPTTVGAVYNLKEAYGDSSSYFAATANVVDAIKGLTGSGFDVGANSTANGSSVTHYWAAFRGTTAINSSGTFKMATGYYVGNAAYQNINGLGFAPDLVIIKGDTTQNGVFRTTQHNGDVTSYLGAATADFALGIQSLNPDGFNVGTSATVNSSGVYYYWTAYGNAWRPATNSGASDFAIGTYYGNGIDNRDITGLPFSPDMVTIKAASGSNAGIFRTSQHPADSASYFIGTADGNNRIQAFNSDGFEIGTDATVNTAGVFYRYFAFANSANFKVGKYSGDGSSSNSVTTVGFQPNNLWIKTNAVAGTRGVQRTGDMGGNSALPFLNVGNISNAVIGLGASGFTVGNAAETNTSGTNNYWYVAWKIPVTISISGNIYQSNESSPDTTSYSIYISVNNTAPTAATVPGDGTYTKSGISASGGNSIAVYIYNNASDANAYTVTDGANNITGLNLIVGKVTVGNNDSGGTTTYNSDICAQSSYPTTSSPDDRLSSCSTNDITAESGAEWHVLQNKTYDTNTSATLTTQGSGGDLHIDDGGSATLSSTGVISGSVIIDSGSTLAIASTNILSVGGSWANSGTFTANSSAVTFNSGSTGNTIDTGGTGTGKTFYDVTFNNGSGGWTIQTSDMKVSHNLSITDIANSPDSWTLNTGRTLEVDGTYTITGAETAYTKWTGSTFYLNGTSQTIGNKTQSAETYGTLQVGVNTDIRMWQSTAAAFTVDSSGSLYSQDHANVDGDLYIWGDYHVNTNDYWSYATDFDNTSVNRQVDVRIDPAGKVTVDSGDTLAAIGTSSNRTTVDRQGASGGYEMSVLSGGTINLAYTNFNRQDGALGLDIQSGATVTSLNYTDFDNLVGSAATNDAYITVASAVIGSGTKTLTGVNFDRTDTTADFNVNRTGTDDTGYWDFDASTGTYDGEAYDGHDGVNEANPGMLRWDDSTTNQNPDTPINLGPSGYIDASGWMNDNTPTFNFDITDPDASEQVKYRIQIDDTSGFGSPVVDYQPSSYGAEGTYNYTVGQAGTYATGSPGMTLSDSAIGGGYYWRVKAIDDALAESAYEEAGTDSTIDFRVDATAPTSGSIYDGTSGDQDWNDGSLTQVSGNWTGFNSDTSGLQKYEYAIRRQPDGYFWSVCSGAGSWQASENWCNNATSTTFTQNNLNLQTGVIYYVSVKTTDNAGNVENAVNSNGQQVLPTLSFSLGSNTITFDNLNSSNSYTDTKTMTTTASTNASTGYTVKAHETQPLTSLAYPSKTVPNFQGPYSAPETWEAGEYGFGYTTSDSDVNSGKFVGNKYAAFPQTVPGDVAADHTDAVNGSTGSVTNEQFTITYKVAVSATQEASEYRSYVVYIVTANY